MVLETFHDALQNCVENIDTDFAVNDLLGCAGLLQEREEGRPGAFKDLNRSNRRYYTCNGVADEITTFLKITIVQKMIK